MSLSCLSFVYEQRHILADTIYIQNIVTGNQILNISYIQQVIETF